jgi:glycosyltransferase involved in cell wall biosynthesis/thiamine kinase-like enzyme
MKILMSALACEPGKGSELEVGFRAMLAAARRHEVWVLTNKDYVPAILRAIAGRPEAERIHLEGIEFGVDVEGIALLTVPGFHFYYDEWQRRAASRSVELDRLVDFHIVHHATLAAYWTRTGVAVLDKPLVWGPVGGAVEPPAALLRELGWRGFLEDVGRIMTRRFLARFGPARKAQRRAVVTFAQNPATLRQIRTTGQISVMTNATVVDLGELRFGGTRTADVLFVGRLVAWKGPMLALRAFRYVQHRGARLVFCGEGYERARIERAAHRWGIADRVTFAGFLPRDVLLSRLATAGALLHPALHEEAGLCVAEALSLGTPAVCLAHGGPAEILRQWPHTPSAAVPIADRETTARRLADAIDQFLNNPPLVGAVPRAAATSFEHELLCAYDTAARMASRVRGGPSVWAFPRGKPQLFADSPRGLSKGVLVYAFGRRIPRFIQTGIALQVQLPGFRRLVTERRSRIEPVCGWEAWDAIARKLQLPGTGAPHKWLHYHSQWDKQRSSVISLTAQGEPEFYLTIERFDHPSRGPLAPVSSFRVPACIASFRVQDWSVRQYELLPEFHQPAGSDLGRIRQVAADASRALETVLKRAPDTPSHWRPIHGDLVPWNLRQDSRGQLWLLDWEDAGWGPPLADYMRYIVAYHSLAWRSGDRIAAKARTALNTEPDEALREAARFWLQHRNFRPVASTRNWPWQKARDAARWAREHAAFRVLASAAEEITQGQKSTP